MEKVWAEAQPLPRAPPPSPRPRSPRKVGCRHASKEFGPVRRDSCSLLSPSYLFRVVLRVLYRVVLRTFPRVFFQIPSPRLTPLLPATSLRASASPPSRFLQPRRGQKLRQLAAQYFPPAK